MLSKHTANKSHKAAAKRSQGVRAQFPKALAEGEFMEKKRQDEDRAQSNNGKSSDADYGFTGANSMALNDGVSKIPI